MSPWHVTLLQMENGILLPTLQSALPFLDLHGTPRLEFHQSVFDELREKLMERVAVIAEGKEEDRSVIGCVLVFLIYLYACWGNQCFYDFFFFFLLFSSIYRYRKLEELLEKSFPLVKMPSIQPVVMQVLKHLPKASISTIIRYRNWSLIERINNFIRN